MNILLIHNKYKLRGGEDLVFESEDQLLAQHGHSVETLLFSNDQIKTPLDKLKSALGCVFNPTSRKIVINKINAFKPDIIHIHNFFHVASPSILYAARKYKIPVVMTLHNYRLICPSAILFFNNRIYEKSIHKIFPFDAIIKGVYRNSRLETAMVAFTTGIHKVLGTWKTKVTRYIALTEFARNKFLDSSLKVSPHQIVVKPNFVEDFGTNLSERENFYLFIGRLSEEKGIFKLLDSARSLPDISFKIIGDGPLKDEVMLAAQEHRNLEYLGFQQKEFIVEQLKKAKALLFPSVWYEGFPMTILEAFSCGTPVIASNLGGPGEIINDEVNGLLFNWKDTEAFGDAIKRLQGDPDFQRKLCINARQTYDALYTPEKNYKFLLNIYKEAISSNQE